DMFCGPPLSPLPTIRLLPRSCSTCTRWSSWVRKIVISSASMSRPSPLMCAGHSYGFGGGVNGSLSFFDGRHRDVGLCLQPQHLTIEVVGGADASAVHASAFERDSSWNLQHAFRLTVS